MQREDDKMWLYKIKDPWELVIDKSKSSSEGDNERFETVEATIDSLTKQ